MSTKYGYRERFDYPLDETLIRVVKKEYRDESKEKGNSWRSDCTIEFLIDKLAEEYGETNGLFKNSTLGYGNYPEADLQDELVDLIEVAAMLWQRLEARKSGKDDN